MVTDDVAQQIVFIDSRVPGIENLLAGLQSGERAFVIDASSDGVQQIADILAANTLTNLTSISIVSHGETGELELGTSFITDGNLAAHSNALAEIGAALAPGGTINLYGCDVALGATGQQFINDFSTFAGGVQVGAATHLVGAAALGGSWALDAASTSGAAPAPSGSPAAVTPAAIQAPFTSAALNGFNNVLTASLTTEIWVAGSAGGENNLLFHVDDTGTATNTVTLFAGTSANEPTGVEHVTDVVLDPADQLYFLSFSDANGHNGIVVGSLVQGLNSPSATPTFTTLYSDSTHNVSIDAIGIDRTNNQLYFVENKSLFRIGSLTAANQTATTLGTVPGAGGLDDIALDLAHGTAYFYDIAAVGGFSGTSILRNQLIRASGLSPTATSVTMSVLPMTPADSTLGANNFPVSLGTIGGVAVDPTSEILYFTTDRSTDPNSGITGTGGVYAYNLATSNYTALYTEPSDGTQNFSYIQVDPATGVYYVSDNATNAIWEGSLGGGAPTLFTQFQQPSTAFTTSPFGLSIDNAPTVSIAASPTFTESTSNPASTNNTPVALGASTGDSDGTGLVSATVTVGNHFVGDVLSANVAGTGITASYNAATGVLTLSGRDSVANYQAVIGSVTFTSTSDNPTDFGADTTRTLTWTINDGLLDSAPRTETVTVVGVNDAPTLANVATTASFTENASAVTLSNAVSVADVDNLNLAGATVAITGGTFAGDGDVLGATVAGTAITASYNAATETLTLTGSDTLAHYQQVLDSITFNSTSDNPDNFGANATRQVTWQIDDGSGSFNLSSVATTTVGITAVNDPPTLSGTTNASFTENGPPVTLSGSASVSDPDNLNLTSATVAITGGAFAGVGDVLGADVTGTSITASYDAATETLNLAGSDTLAHYQQVLDSVTFVTSSDNPDNGGAAPTRTVTWTLNDGSASNATTSVTTTVSITAVNDAPTLAGTANASFTENGPPVTLSAAASVSDPDNQTLAGATVAMTGGTFAGDGDVLGADVTGTAITASYNAATETLVLSGSDTLAHYQQVLDSVTFVTPSDNPTNFGVNPTRTVTWTLNDGSASNATTSVTTTVSVTAVNDPPTLSGVAASTGYTEQATATTLSGGLAVSDPDSLTLAHATVKIVGGTFAGDGDVLAANVSGTSIAASYDAATETLILSGVDTLVHYQSVLDSVTFFDPSDNPTNFGSNATRALTWVLDDGSASSATSNVATTTLNVTAVNDAPTLAGVPAADSFSVGQTLTVAPTLAVSDPDNLTLASATVRVTSGTFAGDGDVLGANTAGTTITANYNAATETLTLSGSDTLAHYQQVLDSVTFTSGSNPTNSGLDPTRTVSWVVNDGSGSNSTATATTTISVSAPLVKNDFNGDRKSDIVFEDGFGLLHPVEYLMNGTTVATQATLPTPGLGWHIVGSGDFNSDGKADILWQNLDGTPMIWTMNGSTVTSQTTLSDPGFTWHAVGTGDFNGDGKSDIVFQNVDGTPMIWTMNGTSVASTATLSDPGPTWKLVATGDFNGDGKSDLVFQSPNGTPKIWLMNGASVTATATLPRPTGAGSTHLIGTGDFNGDGKADLLFQKANGTPVIWTMNETSVTSMATLANPGATWSAIGTGDYNGDGKSDILFQKNDGTPMVWTMNGTSVTATATLPDPGILLHANSG